jgi:hypothetical protein
MKRPIWKILGIAAAALVVVAGAAALWIRSIAARRQAAMEDRLRVLSAELRTPDLAPRPGTDEGNAWDDYRQALVEAGKVRPPDKLIGILANTLNADHAFGEAALAAHGSALDHLIRGARRKSCLVPGPEAQRDLRSWETLGRLAVLKTRKLRKEGKAAESLEVQLALLQFGRDLGVCATGFRFMSGLTLLDRTFEEILTDLRGLSLSPEALAALESRLSLLEASFPRPEHQRREGASFLGDHYRGILQHARWSSDLMSWRYGFSTRLMAATTFDHWDRAFQRSTELDRLPWSEAVSRSASIRSELDALPLPEPYRWPATYLDDGYWHRSRLAHLRLLRTAVRYIRTGEILELDDPFGGKLLHQESNRRLKVWSVGRDGVDQAGLGTWDSRVIEDIVLDVIR